jgi:threonine dehydratase
MAQGVAWSARKLGVECIVIMPDTAPVTKINAVKRFGGKVELVPIQDWLDIFRTRHRDGMAGVFVHPYSDPLVMAGNAVIALEILEDLPDVDTVLVPWGGGGLRSGIASAIKALKPSTKVIAIEISTGAPLKPSMDAGRLEEADFTPNFVDGIGNAFINDEMFKLAQQLVDDVIIVTPDETAEALRRIIERNHVVPEGAGAVATAAARMMRRLGLRPASNGPTIASTNGTQPTIAPTVPGSARSSAARMQRLNPTMPVIESKSNRPISKRS